MNIWIARGFSISLIVSTLIFGQLTVNLAAYADKLYPVDEGAKDPSFTNFRQQLRSAIKKRDTKFILNRLGPNIAVSFGACGEGLNCFQQLWQIEKLNSKFWHTLSEVIDLGGSFDNNQGKKTFCAPYVFSKFPSRVEGEEIQGVPDYSVIIGKDVNVRSRPSLQSPVITTLTYDIVKTSFDRDNTNDAWIKILTPQPGYVLRKFVRHPIDYRACFEIYNDKWVMTSFIAGD